MGRGPVNAGRVSQVISGHAACAPVPRSHVRWLGDPPPRRSDRVSPGGESGPPGAPGPSAAFSHHTRYMKSLLVSVFWPVWEWISSPSRRWICVSYSDALSLKLSLDRRIETALTLRLIFHLPLRQTEGFLTSIFGMLGLELSTPDHTALPAWPASRPHASSRPRRCRPASHGRQHGPLDRGRG